MIIKLSNNKIKLNILIFFGSLFTQLLYNFNVYIGFFFTSIIIGLLFLVIRTSVMSKIIYTIIFSLPISYISIFGDNIHHILSWYNIFLVALFVQMICLLFKNNKILIREIVLFESFVLLNILILNNIEFVSDFIELCQVFLIILPCLLFYILREKVKIDNSKHYADALFLVICSTALFTITQYLLLINFNITIAYITFFANRTIYDAWFKGYSVLSIFLAIGIIIGAIHLTNKFQLKYAIGIIICFYAIVINTSRAGLVACIMSLGIVLLRYLKKSSNKLLSLLIISFIAVIGLISILIFVQHRTTNLFDDNGRYITYINGLEKFLENPKNFLWGIGLSERNYENLSPHNFIIQTFLDIGIVASVLLFILIFSFVYKFNKSDYMPVIALIILGSMFVTAFFANTYILSCFVITVIWKKNEKIKQSKNRVIKYRRKFDY